VPPLRLSNFEIGEVLGVGTVGTIYAAVDRETGQRVAIKKLHPGVSQDKLIRARFHRERVVLERLHHPHIIRYFGGGEEDGLLFYVMELVDGGTVKDLLGSNGRLQWPVVVEIAARPCSLPTITGSFTAT
jgi:eukaryotic-like serine/threonine-protein kinase